MMGMLPPVGWADVATKRDLDQQRQLLELRSEISEKGNRAHVEKTMRHQLNVSLGAFFSVAGVLIALLIYGPR